MAVNVPEPTSYLTNLGQVITTLRNAFSGNEGIVNANEYLSAMGGAAFLQAAPFSLTAQDAAAVVAAVGNLANQPALVTALNNSQTIWGGK